MKCTIHEHATNCSHQNARLFNKLGNSYFEQENFDQAIDAYQNGLKIERVRLEPTHPNILITLSNISETYKQRGDFNLAIQTYQEVLGLQQKRYGFIHPNIAKTLHAIGLIYDQIGNLSDALECITGALAIQRKFQSDDDRYGMSTTLTHAGCVFYRMNMISIAMQHFDEAFLLQLEKNDCRETAFILYNMGMCYQVQGYYEEAIECYTDTLKIEEKVLAKDHKDTSATLFKLGEVYSSLGNLDKALSYYQDALRILRTNNNEDEDTNTEARILIEIGYLHYFRGDVGPLSETLSEISRISHKTYLSPTSKSLYRCLQIFGMSCRSAAPAA